MKKLMIICAALLISLSACKKENTHVVIETTMGDITVELFDNDSPKTVENFLAYVDSNFYSGTIFHRVIPNFMVQGGGFTPEMTQKQTRQPITNEAKNGLKNLRGTLAMARTRAVNSATSQFFINVKNNPFLDHGVRDYGYAVFGRVIAGMDVVDTIGFTETGMKNGMQNVPIDDVAIVRIRRLPKKK